LSEPIFRLARPGEDAAIIDFVNANFDMRLPLLNRAELYDYYYAGANGAPRFALAIDAATGDYLSAAGFIPANRAGTDLWVSVWVAKKGANGAGLSLMDALPRLTGAALIACNNIRPKTRAFYEFLGWHTGRLRHYYRVAAKDTFQLAKPLSATPRPVNRDLALHRVTELAPPKTPHTPRKDRWYLERRYLRYPHFTYDVWAAGENDALLVTRTVPAKDTGSVPVVRLVDYIGPDELLPRLGGALDQILRDTGAEYIDCYNDGIDPALWHAAGFEERLPGDGAVIPNYLAPPLLENTEYYYFTNRPDGFVIFKADGDQDRPNLTT